MRNAPFVLLVVAACVASPLAISQQRDQAAVANPEADGNGTARGKSGFGQVMSVLTGLLQDAAANEATGAPSAASRLLSSEQSAVNITVTPVAGRKTFFVDKRPADGKPDRAVAAKPIDAAATARGAEMAMQAEGDVPD